ncbi:MAG: hypothetical protein AAF320_02095 [Myxococcota bacterium]
MRRYNEQPHMGSGLRRQIGKSDKLPPDDIGNRAVEPTVRTRVSDNLGNAINQAPTHLESGVLQFLQSEWNKNSSHRNKVVPVRHMQTRISHTAPSSTNSFHIRQPARSINRRRQMTTKPADKLQISVTENCANKISATRPSHQRRKVNEGEQIERKKIQVEKMIKEVIRLCACQARVETKILLDERGNSNKILVFVEEIDSPQPNSEKIFAQGKPALAALDTIASAAANSNRNEPITHLAVLPMEEKAQYLHHDTVARHQGKAVSL